MNINYHDSNLFGLLYAFGLSDYECLKSRIKNIENKKCVGSPYYASFFNFILLYENSQYFVITKYNERVINICDSKLENQGCSL